LWVSKSQLFKEAWGSLGRQAAHEGKNREVVTVKLAILPSFVTLTLTILIF
jgi:hypothetical protein